MFNSIDTTFNCIVQKTKFPIKDFSVNVTKFDGNEKAILEEKHLFFVKCWLLLKTMNF